MSIIPDTQEAETSKTPSQQTSGAWSSVISGNREAQVIVLKSEASTRQNKREAWLQWLMPAILTSGVL
jgi:hypothetical protein